MTEKPFFTIEQPYVKIIPALKKLDNEPLNKFMAILWNPGGDSISIKRNTPISYMKESDYVEKSQNEQKILGKLLK